MSFASRNFQVVDGPAGREVAMSALVSSADARALAAALGWRRQQQFLAPAMESADEVLAMRSVVALLDVLEVVADGPGSPITLNRDQTALLAEGAQLYIADRDADDGYRPPAERERLGRLRTLGDQLFDAVTDFAGAVDEARANGLVA
ncbi:hypothetical protein [Conexibacter sp. SYSU D00693]|uniref:hypothetical protein n=1 Tax=Conexibacter sp. SYSU D00693 TaxID=2812560 RepID=UPI00196BAABC|nr:hypothetical protein [Conexibacter sp. SYSU D00693]